MFVNKYLSSDRLTISSLEPGVQSELDRALLCVASTPPDAPGRVAELINTGANINTWDRLGRTPLFLALEKGNMEIAQFLVQEGADLNVKTYGGRTALDVAGSPAMQNLLIKKGAERGSGFLPKVVGAVKRPKYQPIPFKPPFSAPRSGSYVERDDGAIIDKYTMEVIPEGGEDMQVVGPEFEDIAREIGSTDLLEITPILNARQRINPYEPRVIVDNTLDRRVVAWPKFTCTLPGDIKGTIGSKGNVYRVCWEPVL